MGKYQIGGDMVDEAKIKYHASTACLHLKELMDLHPEKLGPFCHEVLRLSVTITDVLAEGELCQEKLV